MSGHLHTFHKEEFKDACRRMVATLAIAAADELNIEKRIMLHHGIADLFPEGSQEHEQSKQAAIALSAAEKSQLHLNRLLKDGSYYNSIAS